MKSLCLKSAMIMTVFTLSSYGTEETVIKAAVGTFSIVQKKMNEIKERDIFLTNENAALESQVVLLKKNLKESKKKGKEIEVLELDKRKLTDEISILKEKNSEDQKTIQSMTASVSSLEKQVKSLEQEVADAKENQDALQKENEEKDKTIETLTASVEEKGKTLTELNTKIVELTVSKNTKEEVMTTVKELLNEEKERELQVFRDSEKKLTEEKATIEEKYRALQEENKDLVSAMKYVDAYEVNPVVEKSLIELDVGDLDDVGVEEVSF